MKPTSAFSLLPISLASWCSAPDEVRITSCRIDIGLDTSSYALQSAAIDNLYLDPARQRAHNATQVAAVQHAFVRSGVVPTLREWALQGTELREAIVPASAPQPPAQRPRAAEQKAAVADPLRSDLLRQNQLVNSWIERYRRDDPIVLPGDPDLGLNASQTKAIAMALGDKLSLIQGVRCAVLLSVPNAVLSIAG